MEVQTKLIPFMAYEHRDKDGKLISKGHQFLRRGNKLHTVHENAKGKRLIEQVHDIKTGDLIEEISKDENGKMLSHFKYEVDKSGKRIKKEVTSKWLW
jgi:hypothetical protein